MDEERLTDEELKYMKKYIKNEMGKSKEERTAQVKLDIEKEKEARKELLKKRNLLELDSDYNYSEENMFDYFDDDFDSEQQ